jgi:DGQHR domain-containing protein
MSRLSYSAIRARQSDRHQVLTFVAPAADVLRFARIDRIGRDQDGQLRGFQRPQIAAHIREIQDYLEGSNAVLPNPIVVAFTEGVEVEELDDGICRIALNLEGGPPGLVVDGQQRLAALMNVNGRPFEIFVAALVCPDEAELRRQFVLINNTRPLSKSLIYELLPRVDGLPHRLSARARAAALTDRMNYEQDSSLRGVIRQHTNPAGIVSDTAIQKVFMNSLADGLMREFIRRPGGEETCFRLASEFYLAVQRVFADGWWRDRSRGVMHTPKTSRLIHGAGIVALGHVMELLALLEGARTCDEFARGLGCLDGRTAWTDGHWHFGDDDVRRWNTLQNVDRDIRILAGYLVGLVRADIRRRRSDAPAASEDVTTIEAAAGGTE